VVARFPAYKPSGANLNDSNRCYASNPNWTSVSYPWLPYIKRACPSMYSYQFDDATSTFTCTTTPNTKINATNYTLTFCPSRMVARVEPLP
jgi:hypothetical protein